MPQHRKFGLKIALETRRPYALALLRITSALLFLEHGTQKLFSFPMGEHAGAVAGSLPWWAGLNELATGLLIALGLFTPPAAFLASGQMAVAYWMAHGSRGVFPVNNSGDAAILFSFAFLYFVFAGPGAFSFDGVWKRA